MAQVPLDANYNPSIYVNRSQAEQACYLELEGDTRFPSVSVTRYDYPDKSEAFPGNTNARPITSIEVFPKFSLLNYVVNASDFKPGQNGITSLTTAQTAYNSFAAIQIVSTAVFDGLTATNSTVSALTGISISAPNTIYGPFVGIAVRSGVVVAYKL